MSLYRRPGVAPSLGGDTSIVGRRIETVETVAMSPAPEATPLKRGVNERFAEPGVSGSNPKPEGRRPKEGRNPKVEARTALGLRFRSSELGLLSAFGLRASDFKATPVPISLTPRFSGVWCARDGRKPFQRFPGWRGRNGPLAIADQEAPHR